MTLASINKPTFQPQEGPCPPRLPALLLGLSRCHLNHLLPSATPPAVLGKSKATRASGPGASTPASPCSRPRGLRTPGTGCERREVLNGRVQSERHVYRAMPWNLECLRGKLFWSRFLDVSPPLVVAFVNSRRVYRSMGKTPMKHPNVDSPCFHSSEVSKWRY